MTISQRIFSIMSEKKLKQKDLAEYVGISTSAISDWKKKNTNPSAENLSAIADFLSVSLKFLLTGEESSESILISDDIKELISYYNALDEYSKGKVIGKAEALAELAAERAGQEAEKVSKEKKKAVETKPIVVTTAADEEPEQDEEQLIEIRHSVYKVSAGCGFELDEGDNWETIEISDTPEARRADYALTISGNSMEPVYYDGDIVLVREQETIEMGQIGIFILDGSGYIKKYCGDHLVSLNEDYDDIPLSDYEDVRCSGRVIGRV